MPKTMTVRATIAAILAGMIMSPLAVADSAKAVDIPAGDLRQALLKLSEQFGTDLVYSPEQVAGLKTPGAHGELTTQQAIIKLLEGTKLEVRTDPSGAILIAPPAAPSSSSLGESKQSLNAVELEEIVITGSRLRRPEGAGASPVDVLTAEQIQRTGAGTVRDVLNLTPVASMNPSESAAFLGAAPIQLRGLSIGTTLVLINGDRVAPAGANGRTFDIGSIPLSAVKRVEVLADGGSAIYGADAIGGIVNVILKDDIEQPEISVRYGEARGGTAPQTRVSAATGFRTDRFRTSLALDYLNQEQLLFRDRSRTRDANYTRFGGTDLRQSYTNQGTVYARSGNLPGLSSPSAAIPQNVTGPLTPASFAATQGQIVRNSEYFLDAQLSPDIERYGLMSNSSFDITPSLTAHLDLLASEQRGQFFLIQPLVTSATVVPATNPFNPFGVDVGVDRLLTGVAPNTLDSTDRFYRAVAGLRGDIADGWEWDVSARYSEDLNKVTEDNVFDSAAIAAALNDPDPTRTLNLFATGPVASQAVLDALLPTAHRRYDATEYGAGGTVTGKLFQLPGGDTQLVVGLETSRDQLDQESALNTAHATRSSWSVYSEFLAPLIGPSAGLRGLRSLDLTLAARYDHYDDFGGTTNPKVGLEWQPAQNLRVRATYGTSFKAPSLFDIASVPVIVSSTVIDPARNNEVATINHISGGSADLQPEEAETWNVGGEYTWRFGRASRLVISLDKWWIDQTKRIVNPGAQVFVDNEALFAARITRSAPTPADIAAGLPGAITVVDASAINFGHSKVQGEDLRASVAIPAGTATDLSLSAAVTHVDRYTAELAPGAVQERRGIYNQEGFSPEWKGSATAMLSSHGWEATLTARYIGEYSDRRTPSRPYTIGATTLFDTQVSYGLGGAAEALRGVRVAVGATNLFDKDPPFFNASRGFDVFQYNYFGRVAYVQLDGKF